MTSGKLAVAILCLILLLEPLPASGDGDEVREGEWEGVERVIVLGDVHGDYDQYMRVLESAGLVDSRGRWSGGETHFVQTGDVPDRGPDTRRILDHLQALAGQAERAGGRVHSLLGNHDAMNVTGDLRYVTAGEYKAFVGRQSERYRQAQWEHHLATLEARDPEAFAELDLDDFRREWEERHPLGWVEHRQAWMPDGPYGKEALERPAVIRIDDTLFVHGGLSARYCELSLQEMNDRVRAELADYDPTDPGMIEDEYGPLWFRGLATGGEARLEPMLDAVLARYEAKRIVVGHTPTQGVVWPRFDGRVLLNDVGLAAHYGGHFAYLEIAGGVPVAHYAQGRSLPVPESDDGRLAYLEQVVALSPANPYLQSRLEKLRQARAGQSRSPTEAEADPGDGEASGSGGEEPAWLSPGSCP